eukprot:14900409-Alexandrium_andersonii.AAC.1
MCIRDRACRAHLRRGLRASAQCTSCWHRSRPQLCARAAFPHHGVRWRWTRATREHGAAGWRFL